MYRNSLQVIRHLKGLKALREWLGLSLKQAGDLCGVSGALVADWQSGHRKITGEAIEKFGSLAANKLTRDLGRDVGVKIHVNSPLRITAWAICSECRGWFELKRVTDRRCGECRMQDERGKQ